MKEIEIEIPTIRGQLPKPHEKEFRQMMNYESGVAETDALKVRGPFEAPWMNVVNAYEPASIPSLDCILSMPSLRKRISERILDVAAVSCWLTSKISRLPDVEEVFAVDLSEHFLTITGFRCMKQLAADLSKIRFVVSDFNQLPLEDDLADCAFLFAALHHSLSPIKTLQEISRCLKPGGVLMILENPSASVHIRSAREHALKMSSTVSEIAYTREELEYLIRCADIGSFSVHPFDILGRKGWMSAIRSVFRLLKWEHFFLNPPTYLFLVEKELKNKGPVPVKGEYK